MSGTSITTAEINTAMNAAIAAQEDGDYATALKKLRTVKMMLSAKPDTEFDREKLTWDREAIDAIYEELKRIDSTTSDSPRGSLLRIPVRFESSSLDEE